MSKCVLGCEDSESAVYFDVAKLSKHSSSRIYQWKLACRVDDGDFSVCNKHFFLKQPSNPTDEEHPDWVPWLNMQPGKQDDPAQVQRKMQQYYAGSRASGGGVCSIVSCVNASSRPNANVHVFDFPALESSDYTLRILSEKRMFCWMKVIDQPDLWQRADLRTLKICSEHFISGQMAALTDVRNIDWIPTQRLKKNIRISDHMGHFGLGNLISLMASDSSILPKQPNPTSQPKVRPPSKAKPIINVGFKCILCLSNAALKPLTNANRATIDKFFKTKLRVQSELICGKCCKLITEFDDYCESILKIQENVTAGTIKSIIPIQAVSNQQPTPVKTAIIIPSLANTPIKIAIAPSKPLIKIAPAPPKPAVKIAPAPPKPASAKNSKNQLFEELPGNTFRCAFCKQVETGKHDMNNHLHQSHKVKIYCKLCKTSFSPNGFEGHKPNCSGSNPISVPPVIPKTVQIATVAQGTAGKPTTITTTVKPPEKYSCYICAQFFTPAEMKEHILTHAISPKVQANKDDFELCKDPSCQRAIPKGEKEKHEREHELERARLRERLQQHEARKIYTCAACQVGFITVAQLEQHRTHHTVYTCKDCGLEFKKFFAFARHQKEHLPGNSEKFRIKSQVRAAGTRQKQLLQSSKAADPTGESSSSMDHDMDANTLDGAFDPEQYVQSAFEGFDEN